MHPIESRTSACATEIGRHHAATWYEDTATEAATAYRALAEDTHADVCVIGCGYTGLGCALELARAGISVIALDQGRIGDGASGRNGGQVHSGLRRSVAWLEQRLGESATRDLWEMTLAARRHLDDLLLEFRIDARFQPGLLHLVHRPRDVAASRNFVAYQNSRYPHSDLVLIDASAARLRVGARDNHGAYFDPHGGHLHPLDLVRGMARAAHSMGARLHETTAAIGIRRAGDRWMVETARGRILAPNVLLAGNGYLKGMHLGVEARVMPIHNFIAVTAPLEPALARSLIDGPWAVADGRFVVRYFRPTHDGRLLFGGGETYTPGYPRDIARMVRRHLVDTFPQLQGTTLDYAWGGTLGITTNRMPLVGQLRPGLHTLSGFSGQGVLLAPYLGKLMAEQIVGRHSPLQHLARLQPAPFPGGRLFRWPTLAAAMLWFSLMDRL